jgi:hypothetical protein
VLGLKSFRTAAVVFYLDNLRPEELPPPGKASSQAETSQLDRRCAILMPLLSDQYLSSHSTPADSEHSREAGRLTIQLEETRDCLCPGDFVPRDNAGRNLEWFF